jgi:hypothetical protein
MKQYLTIAGLALALAAGPALAQDETGDDATGSTMRVIPEDAQLPDAVTKEIALPDGASEDARTHSADGLAKANDAREHGRDFGQATAAAARDHAQDGAEENEAADEAAENSAEGRDTAEAAREDGRAFGEAAAAAAAQSREDLEHGSPPSLGDLLPGEVPDAAHVPDQLPAVQEHP